jgi:branched-chain amino acid transport system substrate-binding protein
MQHPSRRACLAGFAAGATLLSLRQAFAQPSGDIVIGQSASLTGPMGPPFLQGAHDGQKVAFDEVNRRGGINGRKIKHVLLDDGFDAKRALENAKTLVDTHGAVALFGFLGTSSIAAVLPFIAERKVPLISAYSGSPALRVKPNPYFFTTQASYTDELQQMVRQLSSLSAKELAVVYQNNDLGKQLLPVAEKVIAEQGATLVISKTLESSGSDAAAVAQAVAGASPKAVLLLAAGPAVVAYVKANRQYVSKPLYCIGLGVTNYTINALGDEARGLAVTRTTPYPWRPINALTREYTAAMNAAGKPISYDLFAGYINARVMIEALKRAGRNVTPESITQAMDRMGTLDLGGYKMNFSRDNRHGSKFVEIAIIGPKGQYMR